MGRLLLRVLTVATHFYATIIGATYLVLVVVGAFSYERLATAGLTPGYVALSGLLLFLLAWRLAMMAIAPEDDRASRIELAFLFLVVLSIVLQVTGGIHSPIFPVYYLTAALFVYFVGLPASGVLSAVGLAVLAANAAWRHTLAEDWYGLFAGFGFTAIFNVVVALVIMVPRARARHARETLARMTGEAQRLARERQGGLSALSRDHVAKADLGALLQIDQALGDIADITKRALSAHACTIALVGVDETQLTVRAVAANERVPEEYVGSDAAESVLSDVLRAGGTLNFPRLAEVTGGRKAHRKWGLASNSLLASPLVENNRVIGVIAVDSQYEAHFVREEERFLPVMARQVVAAIARERFHRDVSAERAEFAAFYELIKQLGASIELDTVSRIILESVQTIMPYDFGILLNVDHDARRGIVEAVAGLPADKWLEAAFALDESLVGWVIGSKTYLHYPNLRDRSRQSERRRPILNADLVLKDVGSLLCVPLVRQNFVTGLLVFGAKEPNVFTHYEIKILEVLAVQAAVSLENARVHAQMEQLATHDGLTGCYNHRYFQEWLDAEIHRADRIPMTISLVMGDIDHFKKFNDTYGHPVGDEVLKGVAAILRKNVRRTDVAARYGGEEFAIVLLNSDGKNAARFADRVRRDVEKASFVFAGRPVGVTMSMGVATFPVDARDKERLIELADKALYAAKQRGRNQVIHAEMLSLQA